MTRKTCAVLATGALTAEDVRTHEVFVQYHPPASREAVVLFAMTSYREVLQWRS